MADRKLLTLHGAFNLTPQIASVLSTVAREFGNPLTKPSKEGLTVYVDDYHTSKYGTAGR